VLNAGLCIQIGIFSKCLLRKKLDDSVYYKKRRVIRYWQAAKSALHHLVNMPFHQPLQKCSLPWRMLASLCIHMGFFFKTDD